MSDSWAAEVRLVLAALALLLFAGWLTGYYMPLLSLGALAYLAWHLRHLYRLHHWLTRSRSLHPPEARGIWGDVFHYIWRLQQRNRQRKQRLAALLQRFRQSAEALPDAAIALGRQYRILWYNEAAGRWMGLHPRDAGTAIGNLIRVPAFVEYLEGGDWAQPVEIEAPADPGRTLSVRIIPYGDDEYLLLARDMTLIHQLENVRRDFVANVSHELRTPITVLSGYLEAMRSMPDATIEDWRGFLDPMAAQSLRMRRLVEDLLNLSRIELDATPPVCTWVDVAAMTEAIREDALVMGSEKRQIIEVETISGLRIFGNADELRSAFSNLVMNAVQYTPPGGRIAVRWQLHGDGARFAVEDTGIGIPASHIPRLTERFYRVDAARSRGLGGTGLGLAIVKHVSMRHEARLEIESREGQGSRFTFEFPAERVRVGW